MCIRDSSYTITPTRASIGTKQGMSVISYTGITPSSAATVPHGLGKAPEFVIIKRLTAAHSWVVYHKSYGNGQGFTNLENTNALRTDLNTIFGSSSSDVPTSDVVKIGTDGSTNAGSSDNYIMYAFTSIEGFSAFGSYVGNGSATAPPFIHTGFKPAWVMIKNTTITSTFSSWVIYDNARTPNNPCSQPLHADSSTEEGKRTTGTTFSVADSSLDFLSNGFVPRTNYLEVNSNNDTFIYACFAEMPQKYSVAR